MRVTVTSEALDALIRYADDARMTGDQEYLASEEEYERSDREFEDLVAALEIKA